MLRGERARFQLFGDTMNTTAVSELNPPRLATRTRLLAFLTIASLRYQQRMESTGSPNKIQMSQETANLLIAAGKSNWIEERSEKVEAKGKGKLKVRQMQTNSFGTTPI